MSPHAGESILSDQECSQSPFADHDKSHLFFTGQPSPEQAVAILVDSMLEFPEDEALQLSAIISLIRLSTSARNRHLLGNSGSIQTCLQAMRNFPHNRNIASSGCMFLANISFDHADNKTRFRQCKGLESVLSLMKLLHDDEDFQHWACFALRNMTTESHANQLKAAQIGVLQVLHSALSKFDCNSALQIHGVATIANIACGGLECQMKVREAGCVKIVVDAIRKHQSNLSLLTHGLIAMRNVCVENGKNQRLCGELGAVELLTDLMRSMESVASVIAQACCALRFLCFEESIRHTVGRNGALVLALKSLPLISRELGGEGVVSILQALSNATFRPDENKQIVVRCGGIEQVMRVLKDHENNCVVVDSGLRLFRNVSDRGGVNCQLLGNSDAYSFALDRVKQFADNPSIFEHFLAMYSNAFSVNYDEKRIGLSCEDLRHFIDEHMLKFSTNVQIHKLGRAVLKLLDAHDRAVGDTAPKKRGSKLTKLMVFKVKRMAS